VKANEATKAIFPEVTYVAMVGECRKGRNSKEISPDHEKHCFHQPCKIRRRFASGDLLIENNNGYVVVARPDQVLIVS
jgi:hypothetical protein